MNTINTEIKKLSEFDLDTLKKTFPDNIYVTSPLLHKWALIDGDSEPLLKNSFEKKKDRMMSTIASNLPFYKVQIKVEEDFDYLDLYYYIFGDDRFGIDELIFRLAKKIYKEHQFVVGRIPVIDNPNFFNDSLIFFVENLFKIHSEYLDKKYPNITPEFITENKFDIFIQQQESYNNDSLVDMELCKSYKETIEKREKGISTEPVTIKK